MAKTPAVAPRPMTPSEAQLASQVLARLTNQGYLYGADLAKLRTLIDGLVVTKEGQTLLSTMQNRIVHVESQEKMLRDTLTSERAAHQSHREEAHRAAKASQTKDAETAQLVHVLTTVVQAISSKTRSGGY